MAKVRIVVADIEGTEGAILAALRGFTGMEMEVAAAPEAVSLPRELPAAAPERPRKGGSAKRAEAVRLPEAPRGLAPVSSTAAVVAADYANSKMEGEIRSLLAKGPLATPEIVQVLKVKKPADLYYRLSKMRKTGAIVVTKLDPSDATTKNFLVG